MCISKLPDFVVRTFLNYTSFILKCDPVLQADETLTPNYDTFCVDTKRKSVAFCASSNARLKFNSGTFRRSAKITSLLSSHNMSLMHVTFIGSYFGNLRRCSERIVGAWRRQYCEYCDWHVDMITNLLHAVQPLWHANSWTADHLVEEFPT